MAKERFLRITLKDEETGEEFGSLCTRSSVRPDLILDDCGDIMHGYVPAWAKFHHLPVSERNDLKAMGVTDPRADKARGESILAEIRALGPPAEEACKEGCVLINSVCRNCGIEGEV